METFLPVVIAFIFVLAILGIVAGVSNDATNFMSAAVGTKSASYRAVTIIAALGIIIGSLMSNGMMEIARNGVFSPQHFFANEIIYIYLAVMIANLILLDVFNTLGLPTSTSVSLVFELLGATVGLIYSLLGFMRYQSGLISDRISRRAGRVLLRKGFSGKPSSRGKS